MNQIITSVKNDFVKYARSLKEKKYRVENQAFLVEGEKCVSELAENIPGNVKSFIVSDKRYIDLINVLNKIDAPVYHVTDNVLDSICDSKTPQGIAAVALIPHYAEKYSGFIVMLDDVKDPQNVGTIIRTADAAGCSCVVMSENSADCFSPKSVRASMGSLFHIPVFNADLHAFIDKIKMNGHTIVSSSLDGDTGYDLEWDKTCLVIGNEARGISDDIMGLSDKKIKIPMFGKAESLNAAVAAGILIYKIRT